MTNDPAQAPQIARLEAAGLTADIMAWGGVLQRLRINLADGPRDLVLGFADPADYPAHSPHFGATAGRFANRIGHGRFTLDGVPYQLSLNQAGKHHLHGGMAGFGKRPWTILAHDPGQAMLRLVSVDGDEGYPGEMEAHCRYRLLPGPTLRVELEARTNAPTLVNLVHHSYFNLDGGGDILDAALEIDADHYTPVTEDLIPTGEIAAVAGTAFDFNARRRVRWGGTDSPFAYDHNFALNRSRVGADDLAFAARLGAAKGDLAMEVWTTEPGIQFYSGGKLGTQIPGHGGRPYGRFAGLCLETQRFPDAPNHPHFPSAVLRPGETYRHVTEYRFSTTEGL
ncbi:MAG: galactose mutarotase [Sphingomonadales bacterium]